MKSELEPTMKRLKVKEDGESGENEDEGEDESSLKIERLGSILRVGQDKVSFLICWEVIGTEDYVHLKKASLSQSLNDNEQIGTNL